MIAIAAAIICASSCFPEQRYLIAYIAGNERFIPLLDSVYRQMGIVPEFRPMPAIRGLSDVNDGFLDADMIRVPASVEGYPNLVMNREPLLEIDLLAVSARGSTIRVSSAGDLGAYRLGYLNGAVAVNDFLDRNGLEAVAAPSTETLRLMLEAGRFDVALILFPRYLQSALDYGTVCGPALLTIDSYHVFNVRNSGLIRKFDGLLAIMKADGRFRKLLLNDAENSLP